MSKCSRSLDGSKVTIDSLRSAMVAFKNIVSSAVSSARYLTTGATQALRTGDILRKTRVFSSEDVHQYSKASLDSNPVHFDSEVARDSGFEDRVVHGMLVAALFPWIISSHFPGAIYASQSLHFKMPVYIGEEITGEVQATNVREYKNDKYIVKFTTKCFKKKGELLVIDGEATAILPTVSPATTTSNS
ncbi:(R)-specific enoyl-CoA hydratase [Linum perenne]